MYLVCDFYFPTTMRPHLADPVVLRFEVVFRFTLIILFASIAHINDLFGAGDTGIIEIYAVLQLIA